MAQSREESRNHGVVQRRWGSHLICDLHLNKAVLEQRKQVTLGEEGEGGTVMFAPSQESARVCPQTCLPHLALVGVTLPCETDSENAAGVSGVP